jgi:hypothetical protein
VTESDAVDVVEIAIKRHASDLTTKAMALVALLKLSSRFPSCSEYARLYVCLLSIASYINYCLLRIKSPKNLIFR